MWKYYQIVIENTRKTIESKWKTIESTRKTIENIVDNIRKPIETWGNTRNIERKAMVNPMKTIGT